MKPTASARRTRRTADASRANDPFESLVTTPEQQMMESPPSQPARMRRPTDQLNASCLEEEEVAEVSIEEIRQVDADKMSILVGQLLAKNKINAKNAFEVPMILLTETCAFSETSSDNSWKRLSSTLESNNKIYGYRVDAMHNYTYRVLESFTRQEKPDVEERDEECGYRREKGEMNVVSAYGDFKECLGRQLERSLRNINILHLETYFNVNPLLEKTKRIFDQNGLTALLLNILEIRTDLSLRISLIQHTEPTEVVPHPNESLILCELDAGAAFGGHNILRQIEEVCKIHNVFERSEEACLVKREEEEVEAIWRELEECARKNKKKDIKIQEAHRKPISLEEEHPPSSLHTAQQQLANSTELPLADDLLPDPAPEPSQIKVQHISSVGQNIPQQPHEVNSLSVLPLPSNASNSAPQNEQPSNQDVPILQPDTTSGSLAQISDYIRLNKLSQSTDLVLREIADLEREEETDNLLSRWNNPTTEAPRKKRKPREQQPPRPTEIDFLSARDGVTLSRRHTILSIDKKKRKEFKALLKDLGLETYKDKNSLINTRDWRVEIQLKTFLSQFCESPTQPEQQEPRNSGIWIEDSRVIIELQASGDLAMMKRNTSIREAKEFIRAVIENTSEEEIAFSSIFGSFESESGVSPALCFLTVLHLANEHNYTLLQLPGEFNFAIRPK